MGREEQIKICADCGKEFTCRSSNAQRCLACQRVRNMNMAKISKRARKMENKAAEDISRTHDQRELIAFSTAAKKLGLSYGQYVAMEAAEREAAAAEGGR